MKYRKPLTHVRHWVDVSDTIKMMKSIPTVDRYLHGDLKPNFPVPAISTCPWCGERLNEYGSASVCSFNGTGEWCPDFCFWEF